MARRRKGHTLNDKIPEVSYETKWALRQALASKSDRFQLRPNDDPFEFDTSSRKEMREVRWPDITGPVDMGVTFCEFEMIDHPNDRFDDDGIPEGFHLVTDSQTKYLAAHGLADAKPDPLFKALFNQRKAKKTKAAATAQDWEDFDDCGAYDAKSEPWGYAPTNLDPEEMAKLVAQIEANEQRRLEIELMDDKLNDQLKLQAAMEAERGSRGKKSKRCPGPKTREEGRKTSVEKAADEAARKSWRAESPKAIKPRKSLVFNFRLLHDMPKAPTAQTAAQTA